MIEEVQGAINLGVRIVVMHPKRAVGMNDCTVEVVGLVVVDFQSFLPIHPMAGTVVLQTLAGTVVVALQAPVVTLGLVPLHLVLVVQVVPHPQWLLSKVVCILVDIKWDIGHLARVVDILTNLEVLVTLGTGKGFINLPTLRVNIVRMVVTLGMGVVTMVRVLGRVQRWSHIHP